MTDNTPPPPATPGELTEAEILDALCALHWRNGAFEKQPERIRSIALAAIAGDPDVIADYDLLRFTQVHRRLVAAIRQRKQEPPQSFPVTDPHLDAPDGATVEHDGAIYERQGSTWHKQEPVQPSPFCPRPECNGVVQLEVDDANRITSARCRRCGADCPSWVNDPCVKPEDHDFHLALAIGDRADKDHAEIARSHPFAPGTTAGHRQAWLREAIACAIEGKPAPPFVEPATPGGEVDDEVRARLSRIVPLPTDEESEHVAAIIAAVDRLSRALAASEEARAKAERNACGESCENAVAARDQYSEALTNAAAAVGCEEEWSNLHEHGDCILNGIAALEADRDRLAAELKASEEARKAAERERDEAVELRKASDDALVFQMNRASEHEQFMAGVHRDLRAALEADRDRLRADLAAARERLAEEGIEPPESPPSPEEVATWTPAEQVAFAAWNESSSAGFRWTRREQIAAAWIKGAEPYLAGTPGRYSAGTASVGQGPAHEAALRVAAALSATRGTTETP